MSDELAGPHVQECLSVSVPMLFSGGSSRRVKGSRAYISFICKAGALPLRRPPASLHSCVSEGTHKELSRRGKSRLLSAEGYPRDRQTSFRCYRKSSASGVPCVVFVEVTCICSSAWFGLLSDSSGKRAFVCVVCWCSVWWLDLYCRLPFVWHADTVPRRSERCVPACAGCDMRSLNC